MNVGMWAITYQSPMNRGSSTLDTVGIGGRPEVAQPANKPSNGSNGTTKAFDRMTTLELRGSRARGCTDLEEFICRHDVGRAHGVDCPLLVSPLKIRWRTMTGMRGSACFRRGGGFAADMAHSAPPVGFDEQQAAGYDDRFAKIGAVRDALHLQLRALLNVLPADARILCVG